MELKEVEQNRFSSLCYYLCIFIITNILKEGRNGRESTAYGTINLDFTGMGAESINVKKIEQVNDRIVVAAGTLLIVAVFVFIMMNTIYNVKSTADQMIVRASEFSARWLPHHIS